MAASRSRISPDARAPDGRRQPAASLMAVETRGSAGAASPARMLRSRLEADLMRPGPAPLGALARVVVISTLAFASWCVVGGAAYGLVALVH